MGDKNEVNKILEELTNIIIDLEEEIEGFKISAEEEKYGNIILNSDSIAEKIKNLNTKFNSLLNEIEGGREPDYDFNFTEDYLDSKQE